MLINRQYVALGLAIEALTIVSNWASYSLDFNDFVESDLFQKLKEITKDIPEIEEDVLSLEMHKEMSFHDLIFVLKAIYKTTPIL